MTQENITSLLTDISNQIENITDPNTKSIIISLINIIEHQALIIQNLQEENQKLKDEINRLKGEQGKPKINNKKNKEVDNNISSEEERKKVNKKKKKKKKRKKNLATTRKEYCKVDKDILPQDAEFKDYVGHNVQDIKFEVDNILFLREKYYSQSTRETYLGELPSGYEGAYGPGLKTLILTLKNACNMSEPNILKLLKNIGIQISLGTISNILIKQKEEFHKEKSEIVREGIESTDYQQTDHSYTKVKGENYYTQILCNPFYTAFFTAASKTRLAVLEILLTGEENGGKNLRYKLNEDTISILEKLSASKKKLKQLSNILSETEFSRESIENYLDINNPNLKSKIKYQIITSCAIAFYHSQENNYYPIITTLVCDDAAEFKLITKNLSLCWVHEGRHYKKLSPIFPINIKKVDDFITKYWQFYKKLLDYKARPSPEAAKELSEEFDVLFSIKTGYDCLDERISKTFKKKIRMLLVLKYPHLPLHNNASELGARVVARKRDVSLHTITDEGTKANDTFLTIVETCRKLEVNCYDYIYDRITRAFKMKSLADLIKEKSLKLKCSPT